MANRIQDGYRSHMEQNSPDMDKMWAKIQQHIDPQQPVKPVQTEQIVQSEQPETKRKGISFVKYAAAAACLVAVVAGTVVFMSSKQDKVSTDSEKAVAVQTSSTVDMKQMEGKQDMAQPAEENTNKAAKAEENTFDGPKERTASPSGSAGSDISLKFKELMLTPEYTNSDRENKLKLVEDLAKQLKEKGEISEYVLKKKNSGDRIELKLSEENLKVIMLR